MIPPPPSGSAVRLPIPEASHSLRERLPPGEARESPPEHVILHRMRAALSGLGGLESALNRCLQWVPCKSLEKLPSEATSTKQREQAHCPCKVTWLKSPKSVGACPVDRLSSRCSQTSGGKLTRKFKLVAFSFVTNEFGNECLAFGPPYSFSNFSHWAYILKAWSISKHCSSCSCLKSLELPGMAWAVLSNVAASLTLIHPLD